MRKSRANQQCFRRSLIKGLLTPVHSPFRSITLRFTDQIIRMVNKVFRCFGFEKRNFPPKLVVHIHRELRNSMSNTRKRGQIATELLKAEHSTFTSKEAGCGKKLRGKTAEKKSLTKIKTSTIPAKCRICRTVHGSKHPRGYKSSRTQADQDEAVQ